MIGKVIRGSDVGGLLRYLFGPGKASEHTDPHVVAAWDGDVSGHQPALTVSGRHDVRRLTDLLQQPVTLSARPVDRPVWHAAVRTAPTDRRLSDKEWRDVARDIVRRAGFHPDGDDAACRWVAVRHADDHIHLVVTLARQDGAPARVSNDYYRLGEACRAAEQRLDLAVTAGRDRTAARRPSRAESEKATRAGRREPARVVLAREVRTAAAGAATLEEFLDKLSDSGLLVRQRRAPSDPDRVTGYAVALPGDRAADGKPVWFGGGKLSADLSLPKLAARWRTDDDVTADPATAAANRDVLSDRVSDSSDHVADRVSERGGDVSDGLSDTWQGRPVTAPRTTASPDGTGRAARHGGVPRQRRTRLTGPERAAAWRDAQRVTASAAADVARLAVSDPTAASDVAHATSRALSATARVVEGRAGGPLTAAADAYDRAARDLYARTPPRTAAGDGLRSAARLLALTGRASKDETTQVLALVASLAALADAVADLRDAQERGHQAAAARAAAEQLRAVPPPRRHDPAHAPERAQLDAGQAVIHSSRTGPAVHNLPAPSPATPAPRRKVLP